MKAFSHKVHTGLIATCDSEDEQAEKQLKSVLTPQIEGCFS